MLIVLSGPLLASGPAQTETGKPLFPEDGFEAAVQFWTEIFTKYGEEELVLHDSQDLRLVYRVVSLTRVEETRRGDFLTEQKQLIARILRQVGDSPRELAPEQARIRDVLELLDTPITPALCEDLAGRLRYQRGIRERFRGGLVRSKQYLSIIRDILRERGVPEDLAYLPHVESSFAYRAHSKAGAAGIWQLMPAAARPQLKLTSLIDERLDPVKATRTAADVLRTNFEKLGSWPLAITAYNHGRNGMARARAQCGDDLREIIKSYRSPAFGFAGRNFYAEFLAARRIARTPERYFGPIPPGLPLRYRTIRLEIPVSLKRLAATHGIDAEKLREYNPHLLPRARTSTTPLPVGVDVRLPATASLSAQVPDSIPTESQARTYRVRPGDTLIGIGARMGINVKQLREANKLSTDLLHPGQVLMLQPAFAAKQYRVEKGDTLAAIARRLGSSIEQIRDANRLANPHRLFLGQVLVIP